jgi:hypothetical protein
MHKVVRIALAVALFVGATTFAPQRAQALSKYEIDTTYYDACRDEIFERVIGCYGEVYTWGTSSAGAVYKNIVQIECEGSGYYSTWYQWNGSGWTMLPGMPAHC